MKTFVYEGQEVQVPDDMSDEDVLDLLIGNDSTGSASAEFPAVTPSESWFGDLNPDTLSKNPDWLRASSILYKGSTGKDFEGSEDDLAEYGLDQMGWFNYNLPRMAYDAAKLQTAPPEMQKAFLYLMETYDNLEITWSGTGRFIKGVTADPTTYVGLSTLGIGTAASQATKIASKQGIKSLIRAGTVAGFEGAMVAGVSDASRQSVEISAGKSAEFDTGRLAANTALGAGVGAVLGGVFDAGATALRGAPVSDTAPIVFNEPYVPKEAPAAAPVVPEQLSMDLVQPMQTKQPDLFPDAPLEGRLDQLPAFAQPSPKESMSDMQDRLMEKWGVTHQRELDLGQPPEGPYAYSGQGELFSRQGLPEQTAPVKPQTAAELKAAQAAEKVKIEAVPKKAVVSQKAAVQAPTGVQRAIEFVKSLHDQSDGNAGEKIVEIIRKAIDPEGWRIIPGGRVEIAKSVEEATELLSRLSVSTADEARTVLNEVSLGGPQRQALVTAISEASDKLTQMRLDLLNAAVAAKSKPDAVHLLDQVNKIAKAQDTVAKLQLESSSASGALLQNQVGRLITGPRREFASPEQIMSRNPGMSIEQANEEFVRAFEEARTVAIKDDRVKALSASIERLAKSGDTTALLKAVTERRALVNAIASEKDTVAAAPFKSFFNKLSAQITEYVIGTVFSPSSVIVNIIPSALKLVYKPTVNALVDNNASLRSIGASYAAMAAQNSAALKAARSVFNLEISPNMGKSEDFLSGLPEISGLKGRIIRFFPRVLEATDAYLGRMHYVGFVAGETYNNTADRLIKQGLKPGSKEFKQETSKALKEVLDNAFTKESDTVDVVDTLYQIGVARGYSGKKLEEFLKLELGRNTELFQKATNMAGRDYTLDVLFKRQFSGDNTASTLAKKYEQAMNANPIFRVLLQMFVRTPIRVFEEGFRLTPGLNLTSPKFLDDLRGFNGASRQVRAHGEALLSMAFGGSIMAMYANGMITGGGPSDYRKRRGKENTREWQPYTIYLPGGTTLSYRNLDPFATPLKIIVNAMDRMQLYEFQKAQGEYDNDPTGEVAAIAGVAFGSVLQAVKDANLTDGLNQMLTFVEALGDPEKNENKIANFLNEKAKLLIPNVIGKTRQLMSGDSTPMADVANISQALQQRFDPFDESVPTQRDALGNKRYMAYNPSAYFGIGVNNVMENNITKEEQEVLRVLADLQTVNNVSFTLPYKIESLGNVDLRAEYMPDGKTTWYDRIYDIYRDLGVADALHQGLVANGDILTWGVADPNKYGTKLQFARDTISKYREAAVEQFIRERQEARIKAYQRINDKSQAKAGAFDVPNIPQ